MKRSLRLFLLIAIFALLFSTTVLAAETSGACGDNLTWTFNYETNALTISGEGAMYDYSYGTTPWNDIYNRVYKVNVECGVTTIGNYAFNGMYMLHTVELPETVMSIGDSAFRYCTKLTNLTLPNGVTMIGNGAFDDCHELPEMNIPEGVTRIGRAAFRNCWELPSIVIPDGVTVIENFTFDNCRSLSEIHIPDGVTSIGERAFAGCGLLTEVDLPKNATYLGNEAFSGCSRVIEMDIPDGVTEIGGAAFKGCSALKTVSLPDALTELKAGMFSGCSSLTEIVIPDSVTRIEDAGYEGGVFYNCRALTSVQLPEDLTYIGNYAFNYCTSLRELTLPAKVTYIGNGAFYDCRSLSAIDFPVGLTYIGSSAFCRCTSLTSVEIPEGITNLDETFYGCSSLEAIVLPVSLKSIKMSDCYSLERIHYKGNCGQWMEVKKDFWDPYFDKAELVLEKGHGEYVYGYCSICFADEPDSPFADVSANAFYFEPVLWAVENGITSGVGANRFAPADNCTRGQVVTFLWRAAGKPAPTSTNHPFIDIKEGEYYYEAVLWAVGNGITSGMTATEFCPNDACTRGQVVTFMWRAEGKPEPVSTSHPFTDIKEGDYFYNAVLWAVENGITNGLSADSFGPGEICNRGQIVTFLYRNTH